MFDSEILECLRRIESAVESDKYEELGIWTVGGANGTYTLKGPANTEAEWALYAVAATGACQVLISQNPGGHGLAIDGSASYGTGGGNESNALEGIFIPINAAGITMLPELYYQPTGKGSSIYVIISGLAGGQSAFALIAWRRLLLREIPMPPRPAPVTHTNRVSHRPARVLPGQSQMEAGLEDRLVIPGLDYQHTVSPGNSEVPPLTAAQKVLAKLRGE